MRIALDARTLCQPYRRGPGKNLADLYRHVALLRPEWRVLAYHRQPLSGPDTLGLPVPFAQPRLIEARGDRFHAWERLRLPMTAWSDGADLLHCPATFCPGWAPIDTLVTIHDLIPLDAPEGRPAAEVKRFEQSVRSACRSAARILCPSQYTRNRLIRDFGAAGERITVNPWAPDSGMRRVGADAWGPALARYGVRVPFVIHFGSADPRKNTARLIDAWSKLRGDLRRQWQLLVVGLDPTALAHLASDLRRQGLTESVRLRGFVGENDLPTLLSAADLLAYPSLAEGFGLPILDAWAAQTAVLTGDRTSLPEVAGDAALLVDPTCTDAITAGLAALMRKPELCDELVQRGRERLLRYSWQTSAERFIGAVEQAAGVAERPALRLAA
jgi:glycosyltransferase involved in cell wall biosynthesis